MSSKLSDYLRPVRVGVLALSLYVLTQLAAQMVLELRWPLTLKYGPITAVVFLSDGD